MEDWIIYADELQTLLDKKNAVHRRSLQSGRPSDRKAFRQKLRIVKLAVDSAKKRGSTR